MKKNKTTRLYGIREAKNNLSGLISQSKTGPVVITNHGKAAAILVNVENENLEDVLLFTSREFQEALNYDSSKTISLDSMLNQLDSSRKKRQTGL